MARLQNAELSLFLIFWLFYTVKKKTNRQRKKRDKEKNSVGKMVRNTRGSM